ncbi:MAG: VanZ family protein [Kangiellaceae bacterium]|jgi:VanZ family protein|nr:VanZ family protein [Kangiellaceae bacterium]
MVKISLPLDHYLWKILCICSLCLLLYLTLTPQMIKSFNIPHIDKLFHMIAFFGVSSLFLLAFSRLPTWQIVTLMILLGIVIEAAQYYIPGRSFSWLDWLADNVGVLFGLVSFKVLQRHNLIEPDKAPIKTSL